VYEATHGDEEERDEMDVDGERGTYSMGDGVWIEGLREISPGILWVILVS